MDDDRTDEESSQILFIMPVQAYSMVCSFQHRYHATRWIGVINTWKHHGIDFLPPNVLLKIPE
jgi:hypothetical protein